MGHPLTTNAATGSWPQQTQPVGAPLTGHLNTTRTRATAEFGGSGFRRNLSFDAVWWGRDYAMKQIEAYAVEEGGGRLVITVIVRYF